VIDGNGMEMTATVTDAGLIETTTFEGLFTVGPITNSGTIAALGGGARLGLQDDTVINSTTCYTSRDSLVSVSRLRCDLLRFVRGRSSARLNGEQGTGDQCDERVHGRPPFQACGSGAIAPNCCRTE
jgi:hypothetical protein